MTNPLASIRKLIAQRKTEAVRAALEALPPLTGADEQERIRLLALSQRGRGSTEGALSLLESALGSPHVRIEDFYFAGEFSLELQRLDKAFDYLSRAIAKSLAEGDKGYLDCGYLARAYIHVRNGNLALARNDLDAIEDDDGAINWIPNVPALNRAYLLNLTKQSRT